MTKILDFNAFMKHGGNPSTINESISGYYGETVDFGRMLHMVCEDYSYDIEREKSNTSYLGDDVKLLIDEIRNLPNEAFIEFYGRCDTDSIMLYDNNSEDFVREVNELCNTKHMEGASLLYNVGSWKQSDKYAALGYPRYDTSWTWACSFGDNDFPTKSDEFMDYFVYVVIDMDGWDADLGKFGFSYSLGFEENKKQIMSRYKYPESMINLVYGMYLKYCRENDIEPEIK